MTRAAAQKVHSILTEDRIDLAGTARLYRVAGTKDQSYTVTISGGYDRCDCPAGTRQVACSHLTAARLLDAGLREELSGSRFPGPADRGAMTLRDCEHAFEAIRDLSDPKRHDMHSLAAIRAVSAITTACLREARQRRTAERDALIAERDALRAALVRIGNQESGIWGTIARDTLKEMAA